MSGSPLWPLLTNTLISTSGIYYQVKVRQDMNAKIEERDLARKVHALEAAGDLSKDQEDGLKRAVVSNRVRKQPESTNRFCEHRT